MSQKACKRPRRNRSHLSHGDNQRNDCISVGYCELLLNCRDRTVLKGSIRFANRLRNARPLLIESLEGLGGCDILPVRSTAENGVPLKKLTPLYKSQKEDYYAKVCKTENVHSGVQR